MKMKKNLIYFVLIIGILLVQTSIIPGLWGSSALPDFALMMVLAWTIREGFTAFFPWILFMGIAYDLLTFMPIGTHVIIFTLSAYLVSFFSRRFSVHIRGLGIFLIFFFAFFSMLFSHAFVVLADGMNGETILVILKNLRGGIGFTLGEFLVNSGFIFFGLWLIKKVKKYFFV